MNEYQLAKQIKYLLQNRVWSETSGELIWGNRIVVTSGMPEEEYAQLGHPAVLVGVEDNEADPQNPGYQKQMFKLTYWAAVAGDMRGENAVLGANRTSGATSSKGRGILEYSEEIARLMRQIQETMGVKIIMKRTSSTSVGIIEGLGYVAMRQSIFEAKCSDVRYYHPPLRVSSLAACGNVSLTWVDPPTRFDGVGRTIVCRYAAGSTPPASVTDGSAFGSAVARGVLTTNMFLGNGTWSFGVFAGYTDSGAAANERYSEGYATEDGASLAGVVVA